MANISHRISEQVHPDISHLPDGHFAIAWESDKYAGKSGKQPVGIMDIYWRMFMKNGSAINKMSLGDYPAYETPEGNEISNNYSPSLTTVLPSDIFIGYTKHIYEEKMVDGKKILEDTEEHYNEVVKWEDVSI